MTIASLTLARSRPTDYQVTLWPDGVARWDGRTGNRLGAWQATISADWRKPMEDLLRGFGQASANADDIDVVVVTETDDGRLSESAAMGQESQKLWLLATIIDGIASSANWAPMDIRDEVDLGPWIGAVPMVFIQGPCFANALANDLGLVVLAGSVASTSTAPTLEQNYANRRSELAADGSLELVADRFVLTRHLAFASPSAAASVFAGSNTNGRRAWRDSHGRTWADHQFT